MSIAKYIDNLIWTVTEHKKGNLTKEGTKMCDYCEIGKTLEVDYSDKTCDDCMWHPKYADEEGIKYLEELKAKGVTMEAMGLLD